MVQILLLVGSYPSVVINVTCAEIPDPLRPIFILDQMHGFTVVLPLESNCGDQHTRELTVEQRNIIGMGQIVIVSR